MAFPWNPTVHAEAGCNTALTYGRGRSIRTLQALHTPEPG